MSCALLTLVVNASLKCAAVALAAAGALHLVDARPTVRHIVWLAVALGMLLYPAVEVAPALAAIPTFRWELPGALRSSVEAVGVSHWTLAALVYAAGAGLLACRLAVGAVLVRRLVRSARPVAVDAPVPVLEVAAIAVPAAVGSLRPRILLPVGWRDWPPDLLQSVLAHELAHVERRDPLWQPVARLVQCLYWFHPLAWRLPGRIARLAELAADQAALRTAASPAAYARHLVAIAAALPGPGRRAWSAAALSPMARDGDLSDRVDAILEGSHAALPRTAGLAAALLVIIGWAGIAGLHVVSRDPIPSQAPAPASSPASTAAE